LACQQERPKFPVDPVKPACPEVSWSAPVGYFKCGEYFRLIKSNYFIFFSFILQLRLRDYYIKSHRDFICVFMSGFPDASAFPDNFTLPKGVISSMPNRLFST
jgi:hypothetical protein